MIQRLPQDRQEFDPDRLVVHPLVDLGVLLEKPDRQMTVGNITRIVSLLEKRHQPIDLLFDEVAVDDLRLGLGFLVHLHHLLFQVLESLFGLGTDGDHRNSQDHPQLPGVDLDPLRPGLIDHVQRHDHFSPEFQQFRRQKQVPL